MKLLLLIFAPVLWATKMSFSPILMHFLCSNGYMSPSDDIESLLQAPSNSQLVRILTEAKKDTRLIRTSNNLKSSKFISSSVERTCFRNVLQFSNTLQQHKIVFEQQNYLSECSLDDYHSALYWARRDLSFLLSIEPYVKKALNMVLKSLDEQLSKLTDEYFMSLPKFPSYSKSVMNAYKSHSLLVPSLPPLDVKWIKANELVEPKAHYSLLSELLRLNIVNTAFISYCKDTYNKTFEDILKSKGKVRVRYNLELRNTPVFILDHKDVYYSIIKSWLAFRVLGMRIRRPVLAPSQTALGPSLIESFNMEIKVMGEIFQESDDAARELSLKCSCLHMDYLIGCMRFAQLFKLLNHQNHASCIELIFTHRRLASETIYKNVRGAQ